MQSTSTVTVKGQTTLPKAVRQALGLVPGERIVYQIEGDGVRIHAARAAVDALCGTFARPEMGPQDLDAAREAFTRHAAERASRSGKP